MRRTGKILRSAAIGVGVLLALLALAFLLLPKIINTDSVRASIERTISKKAGGTVTFDQVDLDLLPRPRIDFRNITIEVPGKISVSVPAAKVTARLLPLLQGRFAAGSATLDRPVLVFTVQGPAAASGKTAEPEAKPAPGSVGGILASANRAAPELSLKISQGSVTLVREGRTVLSVGELESRLAFVPGAQGGHGPSGGASDGGFHVSGEARAVIGGNTRLPGPIRLSAGRLDAVPERLTIADTRAQVLDMDLTLEGAVEDYLSATPKSDIAIGGAIGADASAWILSRAGLPDLKVRAPLKVADGRLRISGAGAPSSRELAGTFAAGDGPTISLELRQEPGLLTLKRLQVKDGVSDALLTGTAGERDLALAFSGSLENSTVLRLFDGERIPFKSIKGDFRVRAPRGRWREATAEGTLEGGQFVLPRLTGAFVVERFVLRADGRTLFLRPVTLSLGKDLLSVEGTASMSEKGVALDLGVSADTISFKALEELMETRKSPSGGARKTGPDKALSVGGELRLRVKTVELGRYAADAVALTISVAKGRTTAELERASLCGVSLAGGLRVDDRETEVSLRPQARGRRLDEDLRCLFPGDLLVTGTYDLSGSLTARGPRGTLLRSTEGTFDLTAKKGSIRNARVAEGVIAYLKKTSILKESYAESLKEGVPYEAIALQGTLRDGVINLARVAIKSREIHVAVEGSVDLTGRTLALTVLVAPLTGVDRVLSRIPIVKHITGNALVVVPVRVEGSFDKPEVRFIPAAGVGTSIVNLMKNIVQAPVNIIEPIVPAEGQKAPE